MEQKQAALLNIPTAIVIAGAIVAGAIIWTKSPSNNNVAITPPGLEQQIKAVSNEDHIFGNPNAKIKIIEYSDTACPFCKSFHTTMRKIMDIYGKTGEVAWIYRHFPIYQPDANGRILHPNAGKEAEALECAGSLGGNDKFWAYTNRLYDITPSVTGDTPGGLDQKELPKIAKLVGLNVDDFNSCLSSGKFKEKVDSQLLEGMNAGIQGTPSSILVTPSGKYIPLEGAQPFERVKQVVDALLLEEK